MGREEVTRGIQESFGVQKLHQGNKLWDCEDYLYGLLGGEMANHETIGIPAELPGVDL